MGSGSQSLAPHRRARLHRGQKNRLKSRSWIQDSVLPSHPPAIYFVKKTKRNKNLRVCQVVGVPQKGISCKLSYKYKILKPFLKTIKQFITVEIILKQYSYSSLCYFLNTEIVILLHTTYTQYPLPVSNELLRHVYLSRSSTKYLIKFLIQMH